LATTTAVQGWHVIVTGVRSQICLGFSHNRQQLLLLLVAQPDHTASPVLDEKCHGQHVMQKHCSDKLPATL
jgi:hypothetical protein